MSAGPGPFCRARSKRSGVQCRRRVPVEGHLCHIHGGRNPVVQQRQELEALFRGRSTPGMPLEVVDPWESVAHAASTTRQVVAHLQGRMEAGERTPELFGELLKWLDAQSRFSKTAIDVKATPEGLAQRTQERDEQLAAFIVWVIEQVLADLRVDHTDPAVRSTVHRRLQQEPAADGSLPPIVLPGDALSGEVLG